MLKNISKLEYVIGERTYTFLCDNDSPLDHVKEALFKYLYYVGQIEEAVKAQQKVDEVEKEELPKEPECTQKE